MSATGRFGTASGCCAEADAATVNKIQPSHARTMVFAPMGGLAKEARSSNDHEFARSPSFPEKERTGVCYLFVAERSRTEARRSHWSPPSVRTGEAPRRGLALSCRRNPTPFIPLGGA